MESRDPIKRLHDYLLSNEIAGSETLELIGKPKCRREWKTPPNLPRTAPGLTRRRR